jgi:disulfide bond formation protein DsbB
MALSSLTSRQCLLALAGLCIAGVIAALVGQHVFDMRPCPWCILQRMIFIVIALLCLVGASLSSSTVRRSTAGLAVVLSLLGAAAALYQHFVAAKSSSCNLTLADKIITATHVDALMPSMFEVTGSCADAVVSMLGVPFDFWSLGLFVVVLVLASRPLVRG